MNGLDAFVLVWRDLRLHVGSAGLLERTAVGLRLGWRTIGPIEDSPDGDGGADNCASCVSKGKKGEMGNRNRKPRGLVKT